MNVATRNVGVSAIALLWSTVTALAAPGTATYEYDDAGRLKSATVTASDTRTATYTYDAAGNRIQSTTSAPAPGTLQFSSANYSINENNGTIVITVARTGGSDGAVSVQYATSNGTAAAGGDYTASSGTLTWPNGDSASKTFSIAIVNDGSYEGNETINLALGSPVGGALGVPSTATLTIIDDESPPTGTLQLSASSHAVAENGGNIAITVTRLNGSNGAASVNYATSNATATAGSDYTSVSGTLSWSNGDTANKTFNIPILDDSIYEGDETVSIALSNASGAALGTPSTTTLTISENDAPQRGTLRFSSSSYSGSENGAAVTIVVQRIGGTDGPVSISYATSNGGATAGNDYTASSGTLNWANGDGNSKSFTVTLVDDSTYEGDETVVLSLANPTGGATLGSPSTATLTITDNETPPPGTLQFSASSYAVNENGGSVTITVTRAGGSYGGVSVNYATGNGSAAGGSDYTAASGTLAWPNGDTTSRSFAITILDDSVWEGNETFNVALSGVSGATLGAPSTATVTLNENDPVPYGSLQFSEPTYGVNENGGSVTITVTRTNGSVGAVSVNYATSNASAAAGSDYTATAGTLNWANGDAASKVFTVAMLDDSLAEGNETVNLTLSAPAGGASLGSPSTATLTIVDNEGPPGIPASIGPEYYESPETYYVIYWTAPTTGGPVATYEICEAYGGAWPGQCVSTTDTSRTFGRANGTTWYYRVRACNAAGCGSYREHAVVTVCLGGLCP